MTIKAEFLVERSGRTFALYAGLLDEAHKQGLKAIKTNLLQIPGADNGQVAICYAEVTTDRGTFTGIGDASPENVSRMMAPHILRMAETRAKARALRDAVNIGVAALEETDDEASHEERPKVAVKPTPAIGQQLHEAAQEQVRAEPRPSAAPKPPKEIPNQVKPPTAAQEAAADADLPEKVRPLVSSAQVLYRKWRDEVRKANDERLEALFNELQKVLDHRRIPPQVYEAVSDEINARLHQLDTAGKEAKRG